ncbi:murein transglycosylase A [Herbaspirillum sp. ST 5-3]|uniref:murein transglycosylase A n=1 Tax=Oxalobacteraceae TaxID=75682 RepID=UPI0010A58634|nr:murein transglycosylase A [Herbaspirillum sp. ST 5-3]
MLVIRPSVLVSVLLVVLSACTTVQVTKPPVATPKPVEGPKEMLRPTSFAALPGWDRDDLREAIPAFLSSCEVLIKKPDWKEPCAIARDVDAGSEKAVRTFFEAFLSPYQVINADGTDTGLVTGYYEPLLRGARRRGGAYQVPLYRTPEDLLTIDLGSVYPELKHMRLRGRLVGNKVLPYLSRAEMTQSKLLAGKELLWVDDPIEAFFLQVQGSGRVQLADTKETVRVAFADQNGYPYKSIGRYLVDKGEMTLDQASAQNIRAWFAANPARQQELLNANPSYVFFREEKLTDPSKGPKGALGVPLTPQRSIAVDPQYIPLGVPVFLATTQPGKDAPLQRLMLAQDTGGAIRSAIRADYFWGFGPGAAENAGKMKQRGMMWVLLPKLAEKPDISRQLTENREGFPR